MQLAHSFTPPPSSGNKMGPAEEVFSIPHISDIIIEKMSCAELRTLACVCKILKEVTYSPKWWNRVDLPFPGCNSECEVEVPYFTQIDGSKIKLYSILRPPKDPLALEKLLQAMLPSKTRFVNTTNVEFKNYMFSDDAIQLATSVFPSLERLDLDGTRITIKGMKQVKGFPKLRSLLVYCKDQRNWDSKDWLVALEPHLERLIMKGKFDRLFLRLCTHCHFFYNPKLNIKPLCLCHPDDFGAYLRTCQCFLCCERSDTHPISTPGCIYRFHTDKGSAQNSDEDWPNELIDLPCGNELHADEDLWLTTGGERRDPLSVD